MKKLKYLFFFLLLSTVAFTQSLKTVLWEPVDGLSTASGYLTDVVPGVILPFGGIGGDSVFVPIKLTPLWECYGPIEPFRRQKIHMIFVTSTVTGDEFILYRFKGDQHFSLRQVISVPEDMGLFMTEVEGQMSQFKWLYDHASTEKEKYLYFYGYECEPVWWARVKEYKK